MAKHMRPEATEIDSILAELKAQLLTTKCRGRLEIAQNLPSDDRKASIVFTEKAWCKMQILIQAYETEVQWHGCVRRTDESSFEIYDIIVPPHEVASATVTSDYDKYTAWINALDDETFNALHFHGHSHVNMACTPSATDMQYRNDVVTQLPIPNNNEEDSFYIFLIFNKKGARTGEIYDIKYNALYETNDIKVDVLLDDGTYLGDFLTAAKEMTKSTPKPETKVIQPAKKESDPTETSIRDIYSKYFPTSKNKSKNSSYYDDPWYSDDYYGRGY